MRPEERSGRGTESKALGLLLLGEAGAWRGVTALAFTGGGVDAIGLSAVGRNISHMSGVTSSLAGALLGFDRGLVLLCLVTLVAFLAGAVVSGVIIAAADTVQPRQIGARALAFEAALIATATPLLLVPHPGAVGVARVVVPLAMAMGLQNRTGVYLAGGKARTTHVTGTLTDLGYHVGRLIRRSPVARATRMKDRAAISRLGALFIAFLVGGVSGRLAFVWAGALAPAAFAIPPLILAAAVRGASSLGQPEADA